MIPTLGCLSSLVTGVGGAHITIYTILIVG